MKTASELLALAKKATQGEWQRETGFWYNPNGADECWGQGPSHEAYYEPAGVVHTEKAELDAKYIAAACPHNLIPLLERMVELENTDERFVKVTSSLNQIIEQDKFLESRHAELEALAEEMAKCLKHYEPDGYIVKQWKAFKEGMK